MFLVKINFYATVYSVCSDTHINIQYRSFWFRRIKSLCLYWCVLCRRVLYEKY